MSPEQLGGVLSYKSDIWSYGCVMFELLTGQKPYDKMTQMDACVIVNASKETPLDYFINNGGKMSSELNLIKPLLQECFTFDLSLRPSAIEILKHRYFN